MTVATRKRLREINRFAQTLTEKEQEILLENLKKKSLLEKAAQLDKSVKKNSITIEEIVEEVRKSRRRKNARR